VKISNHETALAERLIKARSDRGFTQQDLSDHSGVSQQTISAVESGKIKSTRSMAALAQACRVNLEWLLTSSPTSIFDRRQRREGRGFLLQRAQPQAT
jgi:transcriptional regulator with XRE-family HTH domain